VQKLMSRDSGDTIENTATSRVISTGKWHLRPSFQRVGRCVTDALKAKI
jgi:hypothetical protein